MKKILFATAACMALFAGSCSKKGGVKLSSDTDSLAYIIGMNIGQNLLQMDSTLQVEAVCQGIRDVFGKSSRMTAEDARTYYLRYITYEQPEKVRAYEEQFLEDIRQSNRSYARSESGLTYRVEEVGDEQSTPSSLRDTVAMRFIMRTTDGEQLYSSFDRGDTLRLPLSELPKGLQESMRLIGKGGKMEAWIPATIAYGASGSDSLGVKPNATLFFEIDLVDVRKSSGVNLSPRREF